jgi:hypothetical protein
MEKRIEAAEEKQELKEMKGSRRERFIEFFKLHVQNTFTQFARNQCMVWEFKKTLLEFKDSGKPVTINDIGPGFEGGLLHKGRKKVSLEPFELLNGIREVGIKPGEFTLYVCDIRGDALLTVKRTKILNVEARFSNMEDFSNFFKGFHGMMKDGFIPVTIPEEYRKGIVCLKPFDITKQPAPKADITYSWIPALIGTDAYWQNLIRSTKEGGYLISYITEEYIKKFNLEEVRSLGTIKVCRVR